MKSVIPRAWLRGAVHAALLGAVWIACVPRLEDMSPFPCANDSTCPIGLSCTPGVGCVVASLDSPCTANTDCSRAATGATCTLGICTSACDDKRPCAEKHLCSAPASAGAGVCTSDCSNDQACPPGLACRPLGYAAAKGCIGGTEKVALDGPCSTDVDCAGGGSAIHCTFGVCATGCGPTRPCDPGHLCSGYKSEGACLIDCTASAACPQGLECKPIGYEGKKACVGGNVTVTTCSADLATDNKNCGACAKVCGTLEACAAGACVCPKTTCGASCVDVQVDPKNCGACGHTCVGGTCTGGKCQITTVTSTTPQEFLIGVDTVAAFTAATSSGTFILSRIALAGGSRTSVYSGITITPSNVYFDGSTFYWTEWTDVTKTVRKIIKVTTAGARSAFPWPDRTRWLDDDGCGLGSRVEFASPNVIAVTAQDTQYDNASALWLGGGNDPSWSAQLPIAGLSPPNATCSCNSRQPPQCSGPGPIGLVSGAYREVGAPAVGTFAYLSGTNLLVLKLPQPGHFGGCQSGCPPTFATTTLITGDPTVGAPIDVDGDSIFTQANDGTLERISISTKARAKLATMPGTALPDASYIYVANLTSNGGIRRVSKTGTGSIEVVTPVFDGAQVTSVTAGPSAIVWIDGGVMKLVAK